MNDKPSIGLGTSSMLVAALGASAVFVGNMASNNWTPDNTLFAATVAAWVAFFSGRSYQSGKKVEAAAVKSQADALRRASVGSNGVQRENGTAEGSPEIPPSRESGSPGEDGDDQALARHQGR